MATRAVAGVATRGKVLRYDYCTCRSQHAHHWLLPHGTRWLPAGATRQIRSQAIFLSHPDDDLAFRTPCIDISHGLAGRLEWKDAIHNWPDNPGIDEATDLA